MTPFYTKAPREPDTQTFIAFLSVSFFSTIVHYSEILIVAFVWLRTHHFKHWAGIKGRVYRNSPSGILQRPTLKFALVPSRTGC